jgi:transcriptional regulator of acetoin/glycerol metabolism
MESPAEILACARASHSVAWSKDLPREIIRDSWQRCLDVGLDPVQVPKSVDTSAQVLRELIDQESFLLHLARSEFRKLQNQLEGENCLVGFANRDAILLDVACSDPGALAASRAVPGSCWDERFRGTNAIGTAAFSRGPVAVSLQEHFMRCYGALICIATPVRDPDGGMAGILHVSATYPIRERCTMWLLRMSALHIESDLFRQRYHSGIVLQLHSREEFTDTPDAGLIALSEDGRILSSNLRARFILEGLPLETGRHFNEIFRVPFSRFISRRPRGGDTTQLADLKGSSFAVRVHVPRSQKNSQSAARPARETQQQARESAGFVCSDTAVSQAVSMAERATAMSIPILISGETGTGKEMLARYVHQFSGRRGRFVAVNCAAVPESLIESELFGYREGAFTGARSGGAEGLVLQADGGTLFLDEIGDMPMNLQPVLLRFFDSWTVRPIGSRREVKVDVQLITATNCDLEQAIAEKRFRRDLLYRIACMEISLPPLRERSDFDEIVRDLLGRISPHLQITEDALSALREQPWRGNIRELRNILVRSALICTGPDLSFEVVEPFLQKRLRPEGVPSGASALLDLRRKAILDAYRRSNGNISKAAQSLCVSRNTLYRELRQAGLIDIRSEGPAFRRVQRGIGLNEQRAL